MVSEFIDAYSDDKIYLEMLEKLVNDHPVEANCPDSIKYSAFSRLWSVMLVGSVECMIKEWATNQPMLSDIYAYFEKCSNEKRIEKLKSALSIRGIPIDLECCDDYLAIKYIRNAYVHRSWTENERAFVVSRGFPDNLMKFNKGHFEKMKICYSNMVNGLGMANVLNTILENKFKK